MTSSQARMELSPKDWIWNEKIDPPFHVKKYDANLVKYHNVVTGGKTAQRVFVPLCGKSLDMIFLADRGHQVVGLEFSKIGVEAFFAENNLTHTEKNVHEKPFIKYTCKEKNITIFQGDIFDLSPDICGLFDACWDRGSFVAINVPTRGKYAQLMSTLIKPSGKVLMEIMNYDATKYTRPPHVTTETDLKENFKDFNVEILSKKIIEPPHFYKGDDFELAIALLSHS